MASILNNKLIIGPLAVVAVYVIYTAISSSAPAVSATKPLATAKKSTAGSNSQFIPEDYTASFSTPTRKFRDVFKPLVAGNTPSSLAIAPATPPLMIPLSCTNNESDWAFTGTAIVNNSATVLFENSAKGTGDYLSVGEHWKSCTVKEIHDNSVLLLADNGQSSIVIIQSDVQDSLAQIQANSPAALTGSIPNATSPFVPPILPNMPNSAPINGSVSVQPDATSPVDAQPAVQVPRRGRGRGRGRQGN